MTAKKLGTFLPRPGGLLGDEIITFTIKSLGLPVDTYDASLSDFKDFIIEYVPDHDNLNNVYNVGELVTKGHISNGAESIYGVKTFEHDTVFKGNVTFYVTGSFEYVNELQVADSKIYLRQGATVGLSIGEYSGLQIRNYNGLGTDLQLVTDGSGFARIGNVGNTVRIATITDSPTNNYFAKYNNTTKVFDTVAIALADLPITATAGYLPYVSSGNLANSVVFQDVNGNVGVGRANPSYKMDILGAESPSIRLRNADLGGSVTLLLETSNNFSGTCQAFIKAFGNTSSGISKLTFGTAASAGDVVAAEKMCLTSDGYLGIGTTAPISPLTVYGISSFLPSAINNEDQRSFIIKDTLSNDSFISNGYPVMLSSGGGNQPLILDAARIGIGTIDPSYKLSVAGDIYSDTSYKLKGSGTGITTIGNLNSSATNYTINLPAADGTFALISNLSSYVPLNSSTTIVSITCVDYPLATISVIYGKFVRVGNITYIQVLFDYTYSSGGANLTFDFNDITTAGAVTGQILSCNIGSANTSRMGVYLSGTPTKIQVVDAIQTADTIRIWGAIIH